MFGTVNGIIGILISGMYFGDYDADKDTANFS